MTITGLPQAFLVIHFVISFLTSHFIRLQLMADSLCERVVRHHQPVVNDGPIFEELVEEDEDDVEDDSRDATLTLGPVKNVKSRPPLADVTAANVTSANDSSTFLTPRPAVACVTIPAASPLSQQEEAIIDRKGCKKLRKQDPKIPGCAM